MVELFQGGLNMHVKRLTLRILTVVLLALAFVCSTLRAQTFDAIKKQVKVHTLANGMKFIVLERHDAPVVSFHTYADVGSAQEVDGITGISHILEHMAFKGTKTVGTKDYAAESKLLDEMDQLYDKLVRERNTVKPDTAKIKALQEEFDKVGKAAQDLVVVQEYWDLIM
ncbi:MAG: peptidase M16, partial [Ignavibacteriales bacterium CG07_land_8_20_14_0_80_59_12]